MHNKPDATLLVDFPEKFVKIENKEYDNIPTYS